MCEGTFSLKLVSRPLIFSRSADIVQGLITRRLEGLKQTAEGPTPDGRLAFCFSIHRRLPGSVETRVGTVAHEWHVNSRDAERTAERWRGCGSNLSRRGKPDGTTQRGGT